VPSIYRPNRVNKRAYPGNGSVVGPTHEPSLGISTADLCSSVNVCGACVGPLPLLGCCYTHCYCPCCDECRKCLCTTCTPNVPGGMWRLPEQETAISGGCWGTGSTTTCGSVSVLSCSNVGATAVSANCTNCYGFHWCKSATHYYFAAPSNTQVSRNWWSRSAAVSCANSVCGSHSWYVPAYGELQNSKACRAYWDEENDRYWSDSAFQHLGGFYVQMQGGFFLNRGDCVMCVRAFRKTSV
tara:strand:+ start:223 stop:945 length:723 start_codon:yes stop_codon:yes gene_type:complete